MGKAVLISIKPKWCEKIASGRKTMELRKSFPKLKAPFKVYIYCTGGFVPPDTQAFTHGWRGFVIGEFVCDYILRDCHMANADLAEAPSCVRREDIFQYSNGKRVYGWHISDLKIYPKPKELDWFRKPMDCHPVIGTDKCHGCHECELKRAPQSWCYVEENRGCTK